MVTILLSFISERCMMEAHNRALPPFAVPRGEERMKGRGLSSVEVRGRVEVMSKRRSLFPQPFQPA
jgi:hypothetical protein